jgi:DNA-binding transcriptional LysR family regulator
VNEVVELDELQGIVGLVSQQVGVALVPHAESLLIPSNVAVLSLGDDTFYREVGLVQRETRTPQSATFQFADCLFAVTEGLR